MSGAKFSKSADRDEIRRQDYLSYKPEANVQEYVNHLRCQADADEHQTEGLPSLVTFPEVSWLERLFEWISRKQSELPKGLVWLLRYEFGILYPPFQYLILSIVSANTLYDAIEFQQKCAESNNKIRDTKNGWKFQILYSEQSIEKPHSTIQS